jgi:hypothetical protein
MPDGFEEGFRVTDRRRREQTDAEPTAESGAAARKPSPDRAPRIEATLQNLFMLLATDTLIALGEAPDPDAGKRPPDLTAAAAAIDFLLLLREKTEGHRTLEESGFLEDLVYDLQLRYVRATRSSGPRSDDPPKAAR